MNSWPGVVPKGLARRSPSVRPPGYRRGRRVQRGMATLHGHCRPRHRAPVPDRGHRNLRGSSLRGGLGRLLPRARSHSSIQSGPFRSDRTGRHRRVGPVLHPSECQSAQRPRAVPWIPGVTGVLAPLPCVSLFSLFEGRGFTLAAAGIHAHVLGLIANPATLVFMIVAVSSEFALGS